MNQTSQDAHYFFLINGHCVIGTPGNMTASDRTFDLPFHDLANNYGLQSRMGLASAALLKPVLNPPLAYPMAGQKLIEHAAAYLAAFTKDTVEEEKRMNYLVNNGLVRILITDRELLKEVKKVA